MWEIEAVNIDVLVRLTRCGKGKPMKTETKSGLLGSMLLALAVTPAAIFIPTHVAAAENIAAACSVAVDYLHNGAVVEQYRKDLLVEQGVVFVDDFSTPTRVKRFTATVARDGGNLLVSVDYFSDVGVFHSVGFTTALTIRGSGGLESTSGSNAFDASLAVTPQSVSGNHLTNYGLTCRRA